MLGRGRGACAGVCACPDETPVKSAIAHNPDARDVLSMTSVLRVAPLSCVSARSHVLPGRRRDDCFDRHAVDEKALDHAGSVLHADGQPGAARGVAPRRLEYGCSAAGAAVSFM